MGLHQHLVTDHFLDQRELVLLVKRAPGMTLEGIHPPGFGERLSAAAQSSAVYAFMHGLISVLVIGLGIWLNDLQTGKQTLPASLVAYLGAITFVANYLLIWAKHWLQTGDWVPPIIPVPGPPQPPVLAPTPTMQSAADPHGTVPAPVLSMPPGGS